MDVAANVNHRVHAVDESTRNDNDDVTLRQGQIADIVDDDARSRTLNQLTLNRLQ